MHNNMTSFERPHASLFQGGRTAANVSPKSDGWLRLAGEAQRLRRARKTLSERRHLSSSFAGVMFLSDSAIARLMGE